MVWTASQLKRLKELKADNTDINKNIQDAGGRNETFLVLDKELIRTLRS